MSEDRGISQRELRGDILKGRNLTGKGGGVRYRVSRYDISNLVRDEVLMYVLPAYWQSHIARLPNPPEPITQDSGKVLTGIDVPASLLWWDGMNDLVLLQFPALTGTGHTGRYDADELESVFDSARPDQSGGCVFVPTSALWFERSGAVYGEDYTLKEGYESDAPYPSLPDICNLAQYGIPMRQMAEHIGISKQAISKVLKRLPVTLKSLALILRKGEGVNLPPCTYPGCRMPAQSVRAKFCTVHHRMRAEENGAHGIKGREAGALGGRPPGSYAVKGARAAEGGVDDFLPLERGPSLAPRSLVDQTEE